MITQSRWLAGCFRALLLAAVWISGLAMIVGSGGGPGPQKPEQNPPTLVSESGSQTVTAGATATFSVTANDATSYQWQISNAGAWTNIPGATGASYSLSGTTLALDQSQYRVVVSNGAGSVTSSIFTLTVEAPVVAPTIVTMPADQVVVEGQDASFSVVANGTAPTYAWQFSTDGGSSWLPVSTATTASLTLPNVSLADDGKRFRVVVRNGAGVATSASALLTVARAPVAPTIATQPSNQSANPGQTVSFTVGAVGTSPAYQWQTSPDGSTWTALTGETSATLTLTNVALADSGRRFRVVVSNSAGTVISSVATLSVSVAVIAPAITVQPADQTVTAGQNTSMTVAASGTSPNYQWQSSSDGGINWTPVGGATSATLILSNVALADNGKLFRAFVSNTAGSATSRAALLTVNPAVTAPTITVQPAGATLIVGQNATFSVTATATGATPTYQWETSVDGSDPWTAIGGSTTSTLTVPSVAIDLIGRRYRVKVSTSAGSVTSGAAVLTVTWGSVVPSADLSSVDSVYSTGGSDGGTPGGGDGGGADGGGGLGKTLNAVMTVTRLADGALVGQALTHGTTGLVKIKAGPGACPCLLTLQGTPTASYYDEGKAALGAAATLLPFTSDQVLHALVDKIDENLGATPLTEAAYRYAINHYIVDPSQVAAGTVPLRATANAAELSRLTALQIQTANQVVLDEINRVLPAAYQLTSVKSLPTPVDNSSGTEVLQSSRYGRQQAVVGGLVSAAGQFRTDTGAPALAVLQQLALDLTDGKLDGFALDGRAVTTAAAANYDSSQLSVAATVGANQQAFRFGQSTLFAQADSVSQVGNQWSLYDGGCPKWQDLASLRKDGTVTVSRVSYGTPLGPGFNCDFTSSASTMTGFDSGVKQLLSNGYQGFLVLGSGAVHGWGMASCGMLGNGATGGTVAAPTAIGGLSGITSAAVGTNSVAARNAAGQVLTFGSDFNGQLGLGRSPATDTMCQPPNVSAPLPSNLVPRVVPGIANIMAVYAARGLTFYAVAADGTLYGWGNGGDAPWGDGTTTDRYAPAAVSGITAVRAIAASYDMTFALKSDGTVWGWGSNRGGGFGDGSQSAKPTPVQVPGSQQGYRTRRR